MHLIKMIFGRTFVLCVLFLIVVSSCKKKRAYKNENGQSAEDVRSVQSQNDEAMKDVNIALMEQPLLRGKSTSGGTFKTELCGVDIDTTDVYKGITRLNYLGSTCNGLTKSGSIVVTIQNFPISKWKNKGAMLTISFINYRVILQSGKSVQIDGTMYLKNESGNTWYEMRYLNASNLIQTQTSDVLTVTYDEGNTAVFNFNRRFTFNYASEVTTCTIEGLGISGNQTNLDCWGQTRDGDDFTTEIQAPVVWKTSCGCSLPVAGAIDLKVSGKYFDLKSEFGVDQSGNAVGDGSCAYGWKISWSYKKHTSTRILAY